MTHAPARLSLCAVMLTALTACGERGENVDPDATDPGILPERATQQVPPGQLPRSAAAQLEPTEGSSVNGSLVLTAVDGGVRVSGAVLGLEPNGEFGFHIHEHGDCSAPDAASAGAHFNPGGQPHGKPSAGEHHAGDMVNIESNGDGVARVDVTNEAVTLHEGRDTDVVGKAIIVHAQPDDYTSQPSGEAGARLACGVIVATQG